MKTLSNSIQINASAERVWQVLWNESTIKVWAAAYGPGMEFRGGDWQEGNQTTIADANGNGGYGIIEKVIPNQLMRIREKGWILNWKALSPDYSVTIGDKELVWEAGIGEFRLEEQNESTKLSIEIELGDDWASILEDVFPKALQLIKNLAEGTVVLKVSTEVAVSAKKAWELFNDPLHIVNWNTASPEWHTPSARNDMRVNGQFSYRMEAKDGSVGFDFNGVYTEVDPHRSFSYMMDDGRKATVLFTEKKDSTIVETSFDAEAENSLDLQQGGWQAILDNYKLYAAEKS